MREKFIQIFDNTAIKVAEADDDGRFSKDIVILSFVTIILFTITVFVFTWFDKTVPDSLIYSFFGAMSVEFSALAGIKMAKNRVKALEGKGGGEHGGAG